MNIELKESYKTAVIQRNHIKEDDARNLDMMSIEDETKIACLPTGFFLKLDKEPEKNVNEQFSDELNMLLKLAAEEGFSCIEFDVNCKKLEGFEVFHW